jgi:hypothetical protein
MSPALRPSIDIASAMSRSRHPGTDMTDIGIGAARARWRAAEEHLFPVLLADPSGYQRAVVEVRAVVDELRVRSAAGADLLALERAAAEVVAAACPEGARLPAGLLMGVACGMLDRELLAEHARRRREQAVADARAAGRAWAAIEGPDSPGDLVEGCSTALHVESGTLLTATVNPWSGEPPFALSVVPPAGETLTRTFTDRAEWLAEHERCRASVEAVEAGATRPVAP